MKGKQAVSTTRDLIWGFRHDTCDFIQELPSTKSKQQEIEWRLFVKEKGFRATGAHTSGLQRLSVEGPRCLRLLAATTTAETLSFKPPFKPTATGASLLGLPPRDTRTAQPRGPAPFSEVVLLVVI